MVDLSKVTTLSLDSHSIRPCNPISSDCLVDLLQQASNIHALRFDPSADMETRTADGRDIYSIIIRYVKRSKLRHLKMRIVGIDQVKTLLETFRNLLSVRFLLKDGSITFEETLLYMKTLMPGCLTLYNHFSLSIWMDKRVKTSATVSSVWKCFDCSSPKNRLREPTKTNYFLTEFFLCYENASPSIDKSL